MQLDREPLLTLEHLGPMTTKVEVLSGACWCVAELPNCWGYQPHSQTGKVETSWPLSKWFEPGEMHMVTNESFSTNLKYNDSCKFCRSVSVPWNCQSEGINFGPELIQWIPDHVLAHIIDSRNKSGPSTSWTILGFNSWAVAVSWFLGRCCFTADCCCY